MHLHGRAVEQHLRRWPADAGQRVKQFGPNTFGGPADKSVIECLVRPIRRRSIQPLQTPPIWPQTSTTRSASTKNGRPYLLGVCVLPLVSWRVIRDAGEGRGDCPRLDRDVQSLTQQ